MMTKCSGNEFEYLEDDRLNSNPIFTKSIGGFVNYAGFTLTGNFMKKIEEIDDLEVYDDDVWVCTFPKCGTTWTQEMVWLLMNNLDYDGAKKLLNERFPFLDDTFLIDCEKLPKTDAIISKANTKYDSLYKIRNLARPRCIKTHLPFQFLPISIRNGTRRPKIIHVSRNPKDVCVSYYHHYCLLFGYKGTFEEFVEIFLEGKVIYGPYWDNILSYMERSDEPNMLFCSYEEMKQNLAGVVSRVSEFLEVELAEKETSKLLDHLDIDSMRKNPSLNCEDVAPILKSVFKVDYQGNFIRAGKVGSYKEEMPEKSIRKFDSWIRENLKRKVYGQLINV